MSAWTGTPLSVSWKLTQSVITTESLVVYSHIKKTSAGREYFASDAGVVESVIRVVAPFSSGLGAPVLAKSIGRV